MSLDGSRCINCGGRMKFVKVTRVNTFRTPEAAQYDLSVSRRKSGFFGQASSHEYLCPCCGFRMPAEMAKAAKATAKAAKTREKANKETKKNAGEKKKVNVKFWIKLAIILILIAACAFLAYKYKDTIMNYWDKFMGLIDKAKDIFVKIKSKF